MQAAGQRACQGLPVSPEVEIARLRGFVTMSFTIDTEGKPVDIRVAHPLGLGLEQEALQCLLRRRWQPAEKDGKPTAVKGAISVGMGRDSGTVWHLMAVAFYPPNAAERPVFTNAGYPLTNLPMQYEQVTGYSVFHLHLTIDTTGVPRDVQVVPPVTPKLDKQVIQIVNKWRFKPGEQDNVPIKVPADFIIGLGHDIRPLH